MKQTIEEQTKQRELFLRIRRLMRQENPNPRTVMKLLKQAYDFAELNPDAFNFEPDPYWRHNGSPEGIDAAIRKVRFRYEQKKTGRGLRPIR